MANFPADFVADLRHLRPWPELADSLWRSPVRVELTHGRLWGLVAEALPSSPARVLDIGCGIGALSLESARAGHDVDPDPFAIELAERSTHDGRPGRLAYHQGNVATWVAMGQRPDIRPRGHDALRQHIGSAATRAELVG